MQDDPARYWQDLTANYAQMSDGELLELGRKPEELTEIAKQVLRDEMNKRKLAYLPAPVGRLPGPIRRKHHDPISAGATRIEIDRPDSGEMDAGELPEYEYTWKTLLCDCESNEQAWQLFAALKLQGVEAWVRHVTPTSMDIRGPQVYVAADQLEQAQAVASHPIPQDIIDEVNEVVPEFEIPACPRCGSKDGPVLESADPVNSWFCEACGAEWSDAEPEPQKSLEP